MWRLAERANGVPTEQGSELQPDLTVVVGCVTDVGRALPTPNAVKVPEHRRCG